MGLINSDSFVIFKLRNCKFDLKKTFSSISKKKLEYSQISKFLRFKVIWSSSFEKIIYVVKFCTVVLTLLKNGVLLPIILGDESFSSSDKDDSCTDDSLMAALLDHAEVLNETDQSQFKYQIENKRTFEEVCLCGKFN